MKTLIVFVFCFFSFSLAFSQTTESDSLTLKQEVDTTTDEKGHKKKVEYCCVKKDYCGPKARKCPNDNMPLIKSNTYYCPECFHKSKKPGYCGGKCNINLIKMEEKL